MSRGLGRIERAVLEALDLPGALGPDTVRSLARKIYAEDRAADATEAQQVSVRRAIRSLERKGLVTTRVVVRPTRTREVVEVRATPGRPAHPEHRLTMRRAVMKTVAVRRPGVT